MSKIELQTINEQTEGMIFAILEQFNKQLQCKPEKESRTSGFSN